MNIQTHFQFQNTSKNASAKCERKIGLSKVLKRCARNAIPQARKPWFEEDANYSHRVSFLSPLRPLQSLHTVERSLMSYGNGNGNFI